MGRPKGSRNKPKDVSAQVTMQSDVSPDASQFSGGQNRPTEDYVAVGPMRPLISLKTAQFDRGIMLGSNVMESYAPNPQTGVRSVTLVASDNMDYVELVSAAGQTVLVPASRALRLIPDAG